jgi:hypothetical protein
MSSGVAAPRAPQVRLTLGVTGHREAHPAFATHGPRMAAALEEIFDTLQAAVEAPDLPAGATLAPTRLHSLLADGMDQLAAKSALARGWDLVAPLPFGRRLNAAINARPATPQDARALLLAGGAAADPGVEARAQAIRDLAESARLFELADRDAVVTHHFLARLEAPGDIAKSHLFTAIASERVALAARVMIEQSDIIVAVWDGANWFSVGGTGHTIFVALGLGAAVVWIDARNPEEWRILHAPESLTVPPGPAPSRAERGELLTALARAALRPANGRLANGGHAATHSGPDAMDRETWKPHSHPLSHAYRRIECLFGGDRRPLRRLRQTYETPDAIGQGSGAEVLAGLRNLPGGDPDLTVAVESDILRRFAWADGVSARLSDIYRGGMTSNFILSAAAILAGVAYLPFVSGGDKGPFAAAEFLLLVAILGITWRGQRSRWHGRWFETRRVAEYFRHAPILLALGVARPVGRWPKGSETSWPEWYARQGLREIGLPRVAVTPAYLHGALQQLLDAHVIRQRDYHVAKALRLTKVHRNLDRISELSFQIAVISVAVCLGFMAAAALGFLSEGGLHDASKWFTLLGVALPTIGAAIAGIRYFGDFERFAAISEVTAEKLDAVHNRIGLLLSAPEDMLDYDRVSDLAHTADDIVVTEIENWQAVFGGKHITVPV